MKTLSIKDIAVEAGVSITTVSFIINGKARNKSISEAVIKKVEKIIAESGYKPNQIARSLRTGNSNIIGLIIEDISNSFFSRIARLIEDKAYKKGYKIIYSSTENNVEKAKELINMFKSRKVDGYIISPIKGLEEDIQQLLTDQKPVILFDRSLPGLDTNYVGADHFKATYESIASFIKQGRRRISLITTDIDVAQITARLEGYQKALEDHDIAYDENLVLKVHFNQEEDETRLQMEKLFRTVETDAILFATNYLAISGLKVLKQTGQKIGKNLSVMAYDDHEVFELHTPGISAIQQPLEEIAEAIIQLILRQLSSKTKLDNQQIIFPAKIVQR
ncbi:MULTISPECIES: LacI family DNA-binding transcriptional regulator [unclassified Pedobacter]|uniref:LacI family DNA-binding transcriptional regulator n=1 Tax=unclassified Pedobacter TaxID=2628915 RepID=UPI000B4AAB94|nr:MULTISPECIES: LacI family DNA-binding transcriptional regulator [unclassified Pedobacter]MCX2432607.1 LacI family DNA-binding transcriptional regulator [Pedobacter sp. GR22-10]MCX2583304.1 LacI family DNA-binding transcriptional regulator [Pedobacter sp. MR22-3]OWK70144.1 LacI family transcriptional regulator [Pedobacter sp. AJM]